MNKYILIFLLFASVAFGQNSISGIFSGSTITFTAADMHTYFADATSVVCKISSGSDWEIANCTYNYPANTLTIGTIISNSNGNTTAITFQTYHTSAGNSVNVSVSYYTADTPTISGTNSYTSGKNTGDVTLAGTPNYLTLSGQQITLSAIDLSGANATGTIATARLPAFSGGDVTSNAGSLTLTIGSARVTNAMLAGSIAYSKLSLTGAILNADLAGSIAYSKLALTGSILNADLAGSIDLTTKVTGVLPKVNGGSGWTNVAVAGSNFTNTGQSLVDITGLSFTAVASTNYFIDGWIDCTSSSAAGIEFGINSTGTSPTMHVHVDGESTSGAALNAIVIANNTATVAMGTGSQNFYVHIYGLVKSGTGSPVISIRTLKVTSGMVTIGVGSFMNYRVYP